MPTFTRGQWGPEAFEDANGKPVIGGTVTAPAGYTAVSDTRGNWTVTGPASDSVALTVTASSGQVTPVTVRVEPLVADVAGASRSGTATLAAGAVTVPDARVTAATVIRYWRTTVGGAVGHLAYTLAAGVNFTLTSSSATDTSTVYYEVAAY